MDEEETFALLFLLLWGVCGVGWGLNVYKLAQCDFDAPYKAEVIRAVGVFIAPLGALAGYMDLGE